MAFKTAQKVLAGLSLALAVSVSALDPIEVQSQDFVNSGSGSRFEIIGVDYQPGGEAGFDPDAGKDPLSEGDVCIRDAALMQQLGINTIRVYNLDPYINHDDCMSIFNAVGIYVILDVNSPLQGGSINRDDPESSYNVGYLNRTFAVIEAFRNYDNLIGFFSGNEIINDETTAMANPPYIRAVTRDLKQYIAARGGRSIPVGYSAADFRDVLIDTSSYLQCNLTSETGVSSRSDFFALNSYSWCGADATFDSSTYDDLAADFASTTMPVFFSEFGCIVPSPRLFNEIPVLYGPLMTTWSGGLVYQWTEEGSPEGFGYGLVRIGDDGSVSIAPDYDTLKQQYGSLNYTLIESQNATARTLEAPECKDGLITGSLIDPKFDIPDQPSGVDDLISSGVEGVTAGSLVDVTKTAVAVAVTRADGSTYTGLTITPVSSAARATSGTRTATASARATQTGDGNAAGRVTLSGSRSWAVALVWAAGLALAPGAIALVLA